MSRQTSHRVYCRHCAQVAAAVILRGDRSQWFVLPNGWAIDLGTTCSSLRTPESCCCPKCLLLVANGLPCAEFCL